MCSWSSQILLLEPLLLLNLIVPIGPTLSDMLLSLYCVMHFNDVNCLYLLVLRWLIRSSITRRSSFFDSHTVTGRSLCWDHMQDQVSYILCDFVLQGKTTLIPWLTARAFLHVCLLQSTLMSARMLILYLLDHFDLQYSIDLWSYA